MAPNFLTKLVNKANSSTHTRDRSDSSARSSVSRSGVSPSASPAPPITSRAPSPIPATPVTPAATQKEGDKMPIPTFTRTNVDGENDSGADSDSTFPSVTIVPPSPMLGHSDLSPSNSDTSLAHPAIHRTDGVINGNMINGSSGRNRTTSCSASRTSSNTADEDLVTPTTARPRTTSSNSVEDITRTESTKSVKSPSRPVTPGADQPLSPMPFKIIGTSQEVRKQPSNRSLNRPPPVKIEHLAASASPPRASSDSQDAVLTSRANLVESPTSLQPPEYPSPSGSQSPPKLTTSPTTSSVYLSSPRRDTDSASIISSTGTNKEKKRPWRRSTAQRKPTGLASAIAASSLAMANHSLTSATQAQFAAAAASGAAQSPQSRPPRKLSSASTTYVSPPASLSSRHHKTKSNELSPSNKSIRSRRNGSISINGDDRSEYYPSEDRPDYYSGLEESSEGSQDDSDDNLDDLDLGDDIPVTGFAVASNKRNADFHELFPSIPEGDYLIDDYGCALQREILIQGRLYISENHICFHANIFGWITDLSIPINEVTHLEKKMTAFVIPNGIQVTTRQNKYTFASLLSRDTTFDVIHNIWKLERPDDASISSVGRGSYDAPDTQPAPADQEDSSPSRKATMCVCGKEGNHFAETALDAVVPGTPEKIYSLIFASGFMKDFMSVNQKLMDIQISDWTPTAPSSRLLARNMSYIKPLNGSLGPKQTKCEIRDEMLYCDFDDHVILLTTTRTPEVPSGGVFAVKTRTCLMWAGPVSTRIVVTTEVEWTGRSFIKGIIERSAIDGQKVYHGDLEKAMRAYIKEHQTEFVPEGVDLATLSQAAVAAKAEEPAAGVAEATPKELTEEEERKQREKERNQRGLQWAWDTFDGAYQVGCRSTRGAIELVQDAWEQSTATTILYFVIVLLVFSNIYTLVRSGRRDEAVVRKTLRKEAEREMLVQGVVSALWDELGVTKGGSALSPPPGLPPVAVTAREEVAQLLKTLDAAEERTRTLRSQLNSMQQLEKMD
ncbi:hypothetical protein C0992_002686 [Termitomyces sp. T32_za158]|nr:hypothetical protein C0992_002686 [Termitomyces sp. T32_za158]